MKKFLFLQLVVLIVVDSAILWWPAAPLWERAVPYGRILGFDATGQRVLTMGGTNPTSRVSDCILRSYDVATGKDVHEHIFTGEKNWWVSDVHLIKNQTQLYVAWEYIDPGTYDPVQESQGNAPIRPKKYEILDAATLKPLAGPFAFRGQYWPTFSPDGQWIWTMLPTTGELPYALVESATGKVVKEFQRLPSYRVSPVACFSPDGTALAMQWINLTTKRWEIEIIKLSDGSSRCSYTLPYSTQYDWGWLDHWEGNRVYFQTMTKHVAGKSYRLGCYSLEVLPDRLSDLREEPMLEGFVDNSYEPLGVESHWKPTGDLLIQLERGKLDSKPGWLNETLAWLERKTGASLLHSRKQTTTVRFSDRNTGAILSELRSTRLGYTWSLAISPDTNYIASSEQGYEPTGQGLLLWNAMPGPRWPWAWGTGLATVLVLRLIVRSRRVRPAVQAA